MMEWMRGTLVSRYLHRPAPEEELRASFATFQSCMRDKENKMQAYWRQVAEVAQDNLSKFTDAEERKAKPQPADSSSADAEDDDDDDERE